MRVVVLLLLLMSGDIETNPGPVGEWLFQCTIDVEIFVVKNVFMVCVNDKIKKHEV